MSARRQKGVRLRIGLLQLGLLLAFVVALATTAGATKSEKHRLGEEMVYMLSGPRGFLFLRIPVHHLLMLKK